MAQVGLQEPGIAAGLDGDHRAGQQAQQAPATSPPGLYFASMAYDAATRGVVLFGGESRRGLRSDTWTWDGTTWTKQTPATTPPARYEAAMDYDAATGTDVVFGGLGNNRTLADTWTWDGTTWTKQAPAASPPARRLAPMAYDTATGTVVMWVYGASENQTWAWG